MSWTRLPTMLAMNAVRQRTTTATYGVPCLEWILLSTFGISPSIERAYASLDVPIVPDSSAPRIDTSAPTPIMTGMMPDSWAEDENISDAESINGLLDVASFALSTVPTMT